jgi:hypothetical protein
MKIPLEVQIEKSVEEPVADAVRAKSSFFSSLAARLFFFLLLLGDLLWMAYGVILLLVSIIGTLITRGKTPLCIELRQNAWLTVKRALVCAISLFIALFSPAFGIMIACTYFLMYDPHGIEEVVPSSLQSQFKEFFKKDSNY